MLVVVLGVVREKEASNSAICFETVVSRQGRGSAGGNNIVWLTGALSFLSASHISKVEVTSGGVAARGGTGWRWRRRVMMSQERARLLMCWNEL